MVTFLGYRIDAPQVIASLDILAVPSTRLPARRGIWAEGFGRVAIEAMSAGVPVVAARTGGLPKVVSENETGLLVPDKNPQALALAIQMLSEERHKRLAPGFSGLKRYKSNYTVPKQMSLIKSVYEELTY